MIRTCLLTILACVTFTTAVPIAITGTVKDSAGTPVSGAAVSLLGQKKNVTTDASGRFSITGEVGTIRRIADRVHNPLPTITSNRLCFSITHAGTPVRIDLFDTKGRIIRTAVNQDMNVGTYAITVQSSASAHQYTLIRIDIGMNTYTLRNLSMSDRPRSASITLPPQSMAKTAAIADTLLVTQEGYLDARLFITGFTGTYDIVLKKGFTVIFAINRNAPSIATRACSLLVRQSTSRIARIRVTQKVIRVIDEIRPYMYSLVDTISHNVPAFDSSDLENTGRMMILNGEKEKTLPWTLSKGNGPKTVFAEITWQDSSSHTVDTVSDRIDITQGKMSIILCERPGTVADSMKRMYNYDSSMTYVLHHPRLDFKITSFDTSAYSSFEYWVTTPDTNRPFMSSPSLTEIRLPYYLESVHCTANISAGQYTLQFDTLSPEGTANLQYVCRTNLIINPTYYRVFDTIRNTPGMLFKKILQPQSSPKPFLITCKFKGKQFDDDRYVFLGPFGVYPTPRSMIYFDFQLPEMTISNTGTPICRNGDTVRAPFDLPTYRLNDQGMAIITEISVIIAQKPPLLNWNYPFWRNIADVPKVTVDQLKQQPYEIYTYQSSSLGRFSFADSVVFPTIDPRSWVSGQYLIGLIVKDEYGNEGFALSGSIEKSNPFLINAVTGH